MLAAIGAELIEKQSVEMEKLRVDLSIRDKQVEGLQAQLAANDRINEQIEAIINLRQSITTVKVEKIAIFV